MHQNTQIPSSTGGLCKTNRLRAQKYVESDSLMQYAGCWNGMGKGVRKDIFPANLVMTLVIRLMTVMIIRHFSSPWRIAENGYELFTDLSQTIET